VSAMSTAPRDLMASLFATMRVVRELSLPLSA
jgi:hypothetical protein